MLFEKGSLTLLDGAMGTMLQSAGLKPGQLPELLNLTQPRLIEDIHLLHDVDVILGGHLAPYLTDEDIKVLYAEIQRLCPFEEENDYIRISKMPSHNITVGAALPYIQRFLEDIDAG